jgi:GAF domain-containing protein
MLKTGRASDVSLEELLAFERLLFDLSARFANVAGEQVVAEIEIALKQLIEFLGFDRSSFAEFTDEGKASFICTVAAEGVEPLPLGPVPAPLSWFVSELLAGRPAIIRSYEDFPPEAASASKFYRDVGIRSQISIPLSVGGRIVAALAFGSLSCHAKMARRTHRTGKSHWRSNGSSACTKALGELASSKRAAVVVDI